MTLARRQHAAQATNSADSNQQAATVPVVEWLERWSRNSKGHRFEPQLVSFRVTTFGKLSAYMCLCHQAVSFGSTCSWEGNMA